MATTIPAIFRGRARRDAAAFYLTQLARGILSGDLAIGSSGHATALTTSEFLVLEIDVKQTKGANHVEVRLRWPTRPASRGD